MIMKENSEEEIQIDLFEILNTVIRYWRVIALSGVVCMAAASVYTIACVAPTYTSSLSLYVRNSEMQSSTTAISASEITSAIQLAKTYTVILQDESILEKIGTDLIEEFGAQRVGKRYTIAETGDDEGTLTAETRQLEAQISIEVVDDTEILKVTAVTEDPEFSAAICRSLEEIAPDELKRIVGIDYIEPIGSAKVPKEPSGPNLKKNGLLGLIFGIFISGFAVVILNLLDTKIYSSDFIKEKYGVTVFGEIPYYEIS